MENYNVPDNMSKANKNDEGDVRTAKPCLLNKLFYYYDIYVDVTGARDGIQNLKKNVTDKTRFLHDK